MFFSMTFRLSDLTPPWIHGRSFARGERVLSGLQSWYDPNGVLNGHKCRADRGGQRRAFGFSSGDHRFDVGSALCAMKEGFHLAGFVFLFRGNRFIHFLERIAEWIDSKVIGQVDWGNMVSYNRSGVKSDGSAIEVQL
jgi:hypothetical protein